MCQFWEDMYKEIEKNDRLIADNDRLIADNDRLIADNGRLIAENDRLIAEDEEMLITGVLAIMQFKSCDAEQAMDYLGYTGKGRLRVRKLLEQAGVSVGASA